MSTTPPRLPPFLVTGHAEVDDQHAGILAQLEVVRAAEPAAVPAILGFLDQHTRTHFACEERLMAESGFPEEAAHRAEHADLLAELAGWRTVLARQGPAAVYRAGLLASMERWVNDHVLQGDRRLARHLRAGGGAEPGAVSPSSRPR